MGAGVIELKINTVPGYGSTISNAVLGIIILSCGGDKSAQTKDIGKALMIAERLSEERINYGD